MEHPCKRGPGGTPCNDVTACHFCYLYHTDPRYAALWSLGAELNEKLAIVYGPKAPIRSAEEIARDNEIKVRDMPGFFQRAQNFVVAMAKHAAGGFRHCTTEQINARLAICRDCPQFTGKACRLCGCGCNASEKLLNKLALATENCPDTPPRWHAV